MAALRCPRCRGLLVLEPLPGAVDLVCTMCGYRELDVATRIPDRRQPRPQVPA